MMGRRNGQTAMVFVDIESMILENHLLRKIDRVISFEFIYDLLAPYYPSIGRPSVDPVCMFKMLLVGYLYGIKSERRLEAEVQLNLAYRWFCGFELDEAIPDHSTFSKTRTRKWQESNLFQKVFQEIIRQCITSGLIDGKAMVTDGSYIPANVSRESWADVEVEVEQSMQSYLDCLDEELAQQPGFKKPPVKTVKKRRTTSRTDPDSGYINHGNKRGVGYLMESTVDCKHGIVTGVDVYSANEKESTQVLRHLERQIKLGVPMKNIALDRGYETGAVHRGLELLGITGHIPAIQFSNPPERYGFSYDLERDAFMHQRVGTPAFYSMMRLRKIWAEGSFAVLKREHCISKIRKRGILEATEECLLAVMALNLKRMVKAILNKLKIQFIWAEAVFPRPSFTFVNSSIIVLCSAVIDADYIAVGIVGIQLLHLVRATALYLRHERL